MTMGFRDVWTQGHVDSGTCLCGHGDLGCDKQKAPVSDFCAEYIKS